jgi:hypothetical protein
MNEWITKKEAIHLTDKSPATMDRYISKYKNNKNRIKYAGGSPLINKTELSKTYHVVNDNQNTSNDNQEDNTKHKKEAMQIAYNSEILKKKDEHIREKDRQIEMLINKKSYMSLWVAISFVILIVVLGVIGWFYRKELINTYNSKITAITTFKDEVIKDKESDLNDTKKTLEETRTVYNQTLKAVDLLHVKYNDKLDTKEKEYKGELKQKIELVKTEQEKIKLLEEKLNKLSFAQPEKAIDKETIQ